MAMKIELLALTEFDPPIPAISDDAPDTDTSEQDIRKALSDAWTEGFIAGRDRPTSNSTTTVELFRQVDGLRSTVGTALEEYLRPLADLLGEAVMTTTLSSIEVVPAALVRQAATLVLSREPMHPELVLRTQTGAETVLTLEGYAEILPDATGHDCIELRWPKGSVEISTANFKREALHAVSTLFHGGGLNAVREQ